VEAENIDPGFSSIMSGSVWEEVGKSCQEEEFHIIDG